MSHRVLLMQRINDAIEAGDYRSAGTPRTADPPDKLADKPAPEATRAAAEAPAAPAPKRATPDPAGYVQGLAARRRDSVGDSVHAALDAKFKK
jgi:hypothetical protein